MKKNLVQGQLVEVHSLGKTHGDNRYKAKICGVAVDNNVTIYIVEMIDEIYLGWPYTHCAVPESCLDPLPLVDA